MARLFTAQFGGATLAFLWPNLTGGFGSVITLTDSPDSILDQIRGSRQPFYFGAGRFYLINYTGTGDKGSGPYAGITADGLMAIYQKCAHLGCRVPFCDQSRWFECPCHGSKYNRVGEKRGGPAPRGLDRWPISLNSDQTIEINTSGTAIQGPPIGTNTTGQEREGPDCI